LASNARPAARPRRTSARIATDAEPRSKAKVFVVLVTTAVAVEFVVVIADALVRMLVAVELELVLVELPPVLCAMAVGRATTSRTETAHRKSIAQGLEETSRPGWSAAGVIELALSAHPGPFRAPTRHASST